MADFEKVYSIKFNVATAIKNLERLDKVVEKIEKNKLVKALSNVENKMRDVSNEAKKTGRSLDKAFAKNRAKAKIDNLKKSADKAAKSVRSIGLSGAGLKTFSQNITRYAVLPLAALGVASIKTSMDLNKSMANVATLLDEPIGKIDRLKSNVQDMSIVMGKSTNDISEGLYQVVSALGESNENLDQLELSARAAVAGVASTKDSINLLSAAGKGYNDVSAEALKHTSDLAFQTVKLGVTTFPELAASMGKVIPLAAQFGTSQEELFATMATLTGVTGNTAEVTTQLSSVYSAFMKPSGAMNDALALINKQTKEYNFQTAGAMLKELGFRESIELMNDAADGNEEKLGKIFKRKEAILGVLPLISTQSEKYTEKLKAMDNATGSTDEAFRRQTEGINKQGHEWEKTKQRMVVFSQRLGDRLLPVLDKMLTFAEPIIEWLEGMDEGTIDAAISWGKLVIQLGLGLKLLQGFSALSNGVASGISAIGSAAGGATGQVSGMAGALSKLNGGIAALAVGVAVGGVIWQLIDQADKRNLREKNKGTQKSRQAVSVLKDSSASVADVDAAINKITRKYSTSRTNNGEAVLEAQQKDTAGVFHDKTDESDSDFLWLQDLKRKRKNLIDTQAGSGRFLFEGETGSENQSLPSFGSGAEIDPWATGQSRDTGGGGGQNININQGNTTIHTGADAKSVGLELDKRDKRTEQELKRAVAEAAG
ncbi:phage tail tape measure protein [Candidatus Pacearchaeota archaeon]|nr:phage tail tape measure protein [Candidatus Pacearchaeota archaeon]